VRGASSPRPKIALASLDLGWPAKALDAARATLEGHGDPANAELLDEIVLKGGGLEAWRNNHDHDLNTAAQIGPQIDATISEVTTKNAPHYFRYLARAVGHLDKRDAIIQAVAEQRNCAHLC
jgi:hypothetical protein